MLTNTETGVSHCNCYKGRDWIKNSMYVSNAIYSTLINTQIKEIIASEDTLLDVSTMKFN